MAPHFRDITDLAVEREQMGGFEPVGYASASAVDPATGNRVHVVLSKRRGRGTRWIEIVTPDVATYDREIGPYRQGNTDWNRILALHGLNRFAIAASDLGGTWSDNYASATSMVFVNTGWSAGTMYTGGSSELRVNGGSYQLAVTIAQGIAPAIQWRRETFAGAITVPDPWHLRLTGGFQGRTDVFDASFEAVKGGRILNLSTAANGSPIAYHFIRVN